MKLSPIKSKFIYAGISEKNSDQLEHALKGLPLCIDKGIHNHILSKPHPARNAYVGAITTRINNLSNIIDTRMINAGEHMIRNASMDVASSILTLKHAHPSLNFKEIIDLFYTNSNSLEIPKIRLPKADLDNNVLTPIEVKFWQKKILLTIRQNRELLSYRLGLISENALQYCTDECVDENKNDVKKREEFAKTLVIANTQTGEYFPANQSISAKSQSYSENVCLLNELNKYSIKHDLEVALVTITVPPSMHMSYQKKSVFSPSDVHNYILKRWQKYTSQTTQWTTPCFSFKVIEPHDDGTPHWHVMMFYTKKMQKDHQDALLDAFGLKSFKSKRIKWDILPHDKNSKDKNDRKKVIGYLLKKIKDQSSAEITYESTVSRRSAFLNVWKIRGQEFSGLPINTKTLWRELRSKNKYPFTLCKELEQLKTFATTNQFAHFLELYIQHKHKIQIIKTKRETSDSKKITGIKWDNTEYFAHNSNFVIIPTRKAKSVLERKTTELTINKPRTAEIKITDLKPPANQQQNSSQPIRKTIKTSFLISIRNKTSEFTKFLFKKFRALKNHYTSCKTPLISPLVLTQKDESP